MIKTINPFSGQVIEEYQEQSADEISQAIDKAHAQFQEWRGSSFSTRSKMLERVAKVLKDEKQSLAELMTQEMGKPLSESVAEVEKCIKVCHYYAENGEAFLQPESIDTEYAESFVSYSPLGCILAIMPWNFPLWQVFRFAAPTLMAGNSILLKHAGAVTGSALAVESVFAKAGLPTDLFKTLIAKSDKMEAVIENPKVRAVTLTGSTQAGESVAEIAGKNLKKTVLELGGSDAYLILKDADLSDAVKLCTKSRLLNSGQSCIAGKRFIVHRDVIEEFTRMMVVEFQKQKMGDPMDPSVSIGPMAREDLRDELHKQVSQSISGGAQCVTGGTVPEKSGAFYPPTILTGVRKGMPAFDQEMFGPVAAIIEASSTEEAVALANDSDYGLGGGIFTKNIELAKKIATENFESGACFINDFTKSDPRLPFGGIKDSGYGRELSSFGIKEFVNAKTVCISN